MTIGNIFMFLNILIFLNSSIGLNVLTSSETNELALYKYLTNGYNNKVRPARIPKTTVLVELTLYINQVLVVDEKNQMIQTFLSMNASWKDDYLVWNPANFSNIQRLIINSNDVWIPALTIVNAARGIDVLSNEQNFAGEVSSNGNVAFILPKNIYTSCIFDLRLFPFDSQQCNIILALYAYRCSEVNLTMKRDTFDMNWYTTHSEWHLKKTNIRNMYYHHGSEVFCSINGSLYLERKSLYLINNVVIPCVLISFISLATFGVPAESGEKISLSMTTLLSYSVFLLVLTDMLPRNSDSGPILTYYIISIMAVTAVSLLCSVLIVRFHYRMAPPPKWIRILILRYLAKTCFINMEKILPLENKNGKDMYKGEPIETAEEISIIWRATGRVLDRFFLILFFFVIICLSLILLIGIPTSK